MSNVDFNEDEAKVASKQLVADIFLVDPNTGNGLFVLAPPFETEEGKLAILCADSVESEQYVMHVVESVYVNRDEVQFAPANDSGLISDPNSGKLVGLDGQPLN